MAKIIPRVGKRCTVCLAAATVVLLSGPLSAQANLIWDWSGDCQGAAQGSVRPCQHATMRFVTTDAYVPGEVFGPAFPVPGVLLEALYTDDVVRFDFLNPAGWPRNGDSLLLPATATGLGGILTDPASFRSDTQGNWRFGAEGASPDPCNIDTIGNPLCAYGVRGINGVWTRVPAPSTLALLGMGLAGLFVFRKKRSA